MNKYLVTVKWIYTGEVEVEAPTKEEAERLAMSEDCEEVPDTLHEVIVTEIEQDA